MIHRRTGIGPVAVAAVLATFGAASAQDIKIGYSGALSGPASFTGLDIRRGAEIAIDEINAKGGVKGRKLVLVSRDDEHNPVRTVAQYRELVERERVVAMLGATNSASMLAVTPIVNDSLKVPVICPATDATAITENDAAKAGQDNYLFRIGMYGTGQANFITDTMVKRFGHTKVALLNWTGGWGVTGRTELQRRLKEHGLTPVADETFDSNDTDMTPQIIKIKNAGAQSILNYALVRENTLVAQTKQKLGDDTPYASAWGIAGPAFWKAAGSAAEGILSSTTITIDGPQSPERLALIETYRKRYNQDMDAPTSVFGAYDSIYLYKLVMERDGTDPKAIRAGLENVPEFKGLIKDFKRPVFTKQRHNAITEEDMIMTRWTNGKMLEIKYDDKGPYVDIDEKTKKYLDKKNMALM
ncbi:MAG: amino acid transporter substrate-binding protein [Rhodospirillales bacterium]|jgi:branched-chain amino acid transport system substrate-binding protein|nr:amino acid transporter substrate-binding protein [Rhodospirillales bacterium]